LQIPVPPLQLPLQQNPTSSGTVHDPEPEGTQHQPSAVVQLSTQPALPGVQQCSVPMQSPFTVHPSPMAPCKQVCVMLSHRKVTHSSGPSAAHEPPGVLSIAQWPVSHQFPGSQSASLLQFPPAALRHSSDPQLGVDEVLAHRPLRQSLLLVHDC